MQRRIFQKCGDMEKSDVLAEEVAVEDIEKPENVNSIFERTSPIVLSSSTFWSMLKKWMR